MNSLLRTLAKLLAGGVFISIAQSVAGCTFDDPATEIIEAAKCTAPFIPVWAQAIVGTAAVGLDFLLKAFGNGGNPWENLTAKTVVVLPEYKAGQGTVTQAQVDEPA